MPAGLITYTEKGNVSFDSTKNTIVYLGSFKAQYGKETSFTDVNIKGRKVFISLRSLTLVKKQTHDFLATPCSFSQSNNTISWKYANMPSSFKDYEWVSTLGTLGSDSIELKYKNFPTPSIYAATYDYGVII